MYGVITTVPAPVAMYDGMHAEMLKMQRRTGTSVDGLLVHVGRATPDGFEVLEVWESKELYDGANAVGTLIFIASWAARSHSRHRLGVRLGRLGGLVLMSGAIIGGYMRSDRQPEPDPGQAG